MEPKDRLIVAVDISKIEKAKVLVDELYFDVGYFKLGLEWISSTLSSLISLEDDTMALEYLSSVRQFISPIRERIFWDIKLDDIPNTVAKASFAIAQMGVKMFNVHASAGRKSIEAAVQNRGNSLVFGVTVLTSIDEEECLSIFGEKPGPKVLQFSRILLETGADGVICSPQELEFLAQYPELERFQRATPGVRPKWATAGDQKRFMTPAEAVRAGAEYLIIGRPISDPPPEIGSPRNAARRIAAEIAAAT